MKQEGIPGSPVPGCGLERYSDAAWAQPLGPSAPPTEWGGIGPRRAGVGLHIRHRAQGRALFCPGPRAELSLPQISDSIRVGS